MRGVTSLPTARFEHAPLTRYVKDRVEETALSLMSQEAGAEFAQNRVIEAAIGEVKTQQVFPIQARPDGVSRLAIRQSLHKLEQRNKGEARRSLSRLALRGKEFNEVAVVEEHVEVIIHAHHKIARWEDGVGNTGRLLWNEVNDLWLK
jgi:hypothetical protein